MRYYNPFRFFFFFTDSFVNSQEWTLSRSVPDLRLGIVGSLSSGKSALVHRYLTGSYMQEESPEGGRFKKEISVDGHSHLLLIRDEGGSPELQVSDHIYRVKIHFFFLSPPSAILFRYRAGPFQEGDFGEGGGVSPLHEVV